MPDLLFEIYCEELPASYIEPALEQMAFLFTESIVSANISAPPGGGLLFATPRRLVMFTPGLPEGQEDKEVEVPGPSENAAYKDGKPTKALEGFVKKQCVSIDEVYLIDGPKGKKCAIKKLVKGKSTDELLTAILPDLIGKISFPKSMHWVEGSKLTFARPIRNILAVLDDKVVNFEWNGVRSSNRSFGHSTYSDSSFSVPKADIEHFKIELESLNVVLDHEERKNSIRTAIGFKSQKDWDQKSELAEEVSFLTEWPVAITGSYNAKYLTLPTCVLEAAMMEHQRYFPCYLPGDIKNLTLSNEFIFFADRPGDSADAIRTGNERVLRARLEDALFFFNKDGQVRFDDLAQMMQDVVFHKDIGNYGQKAERISKLGMFIASCLFDNKDVTDHAESAGLMSKADLATEMVGEFPSLQGKVGREYALLQGFPEEVANALEEHYMPTSAGGALPKSKAGISLALADKFDSITAFIATGHTPTGAGDPFGLRRAAYGIIRIILENSLKLSVQDVIRDAISVLQDLSTIKELPVDLHEQVVHFLRTRFKLACQDESIMTSKVFKYDEIDAVVDSSFDDLNDAVKCLDAIVELRQNKDTWEPLVEIVERTYNIAKNAPEPGDINLELLTEDAEKVLFEVFDKTGEEFSHLIEDEKYVEAAKLYHDNLKDPVHRFFDEVYVNVDDELVRQNRIALSWAINRLFVENIADLKKIVIPGKEG